MKGEQERNTWIIKKTEYLICIIIVSLITLIFFWYLNHSFTSGLEQIQNSHAKLSLDYFDNFEKDTVNNTIQYNDFAPILKSHMNVITDELQLQSERLKSDYNILSLWAAALMIIFLIFSMYAMYKGDELHKESRNILKESRTIHFDLEEKKKNLDGYLKEEENRVNEIKNHALEKLDEAKKNIDSAISQSQESIKSIEKSHAEGLKKLEEDTKGNIYEIIQKKEEELNQKLKENIEEAKHQLTLHIEEFKPLLEESKDYIVQLTEIAKGMREPLEENIRNKLMELVNNRIKETESSFFKKIDELKNRSMPYNMTENNNNIEV